MKSLLLAGGLSKRMGRNKALIVRPDGTRQIDYLVDLVRQLVPDVLLSTNEPSIAPDGLPILPDLNPGDGPLGALASFHAAHPDESVLAVSCDLFLLDLGTLRFLLQNHDPSRGATCFANRLDGKVEPLCSIYEPSVLADISTFVASREFCARRFLASRQPRLLELPNPVALDNANTPQDLDEAFAKLKYGVSRKSIRVLHFAKLREERGLDEETLTTLAATPAGAYEELRYLHRLSLHIENLRCALNGDFCDWNTPLKDGDELVFIPPVAGG